MLNSEIRSIGVAHAEWLKSGGISGFRADFSGLDLSMADFSGINFSDALFVKTKLERANLSSCLLTRAIFRGAHLGYSNMNRVNLDGADLSGVDATGVRFENASLQNALLSNARFDNSQFARANFSGAQGCLIRFDHCNFAYAVFDRVNFEDVLFTKANLTNASVIGMSLWWGSFEGATVCGVDFATTAKLDSIDSAGNVLSQKFGLGDAELTEQQMQRLRRLHLKKFEVGDIADRLGISRSAVQVNIERLKVELNTNTPIETKYRLANAFKLLGGLSFAVAGLSLSIVLISGVADIFRLLVDRRNQGFEGYWYLIWLMVTIVSCSVGIYSFSKRESLTQSALAYLDRRERGDATIKQNGIESSKKRLSNDVVENS